MVKDEYSKHEAVSIKAGRTLDDIGRDIVDIMYTVHKHMGPGLNEAVYEECMCMELENRHIPFSCQEPIAIEYRGRPLETRYIADLLVEGRVIVEIKAVKELLPVHEAQILNYLKLTDRQLGYLVNFNVPVIKNGIRRRVNNYRSETLV